MKEIFIVAEKEIRDFFTGRRFLILMAIMMVLVIIGLINGMQNYNNQLDQYKTQQDQNAQSASFQQMIEQQRQQIETMKANGESQDTIDQMQASLDQMTNPPMPSMLNNFYQFYNAFSIVGAALAIVMGFNLISGERESGSLRLLLTRPTYRDSVINGKALAGILTITVMLGAAFLITMAVLLVLGVVPSGDDLYRIIAYFAATIVYVTAFFAISMLVSAFTRTSTMSILCMLGIFLFIYIMPGAVSSISTTVMGPYPQSPQFPSMPMPQFTPPPMDANGTPIATPIPTLSPEMQAFQEAQWKYQNDTINYQVTQEQIRDISSLFSPMDSYSQLTSGLLNKQKPYDPSDMFGGRWYMQQKELTLFESLGYMWSNVIALLVMIGAAFGISYIAFMRSDVA